MYLLAAYLLNIPRILLEYGFDFSEILRFFKTDVFTFDNLIRMILVSHSKISGVAWFLISLLTCYVLKYLIGKNLRYLGYLGLIVGIVAVLPPVSGCVGIYKYINTAWLNGIPFFIIGDLLNEYKVMADKKISNVLLAFSSLLGFVLIVVATFYGTEWWHIGTLLLSPSLFVLFGRMDMKYNVMCLLGSIYAFFIYIVHPLVIHVYDAVRPSPSITESWLRPLIVLMVTILLAVVYYSIKRMVLKAKKE